MARYTDNYILMLSASKIFSYAGQRIAVAAISDKLYGRTYPALRERYNIGRLGDAYVLGILYGASSGTSHSAQCALAAMFDAAAEGRLDFVGHASGVCAARGAQQGRSSCATASTSSMTRTATSTSATASSTRSAAAA